MRDKHHRKGPYRIGGLICCPESAWRTGSNFQSERAQTCEGSGPSAAWCTVRSRASGIPAQSRAVRQSTGGSGNRRDIRNGAGSGIACQGAAEKPIVKLEAGMPHSYIPQKVGGGGDPGEKQRGNFDRGIRQAEVSTSEVYRTAFHPHNPLEPHATLAAWDGPNKLTLYEAVVEMSGGAPAEVAVVDGQVVIRRDGATQTLKELLAKSGRPYVEAQAKTQSNDAKKYASYSFGAQFAEVRVDADLGQIFVSRMVAVFAPGRILNAKTARSQFMGGMIWGISLALLESTVYDERLGRIVNNNLAEYHVPTNADVGKLDISWVEEFDPQVSPIGAKGIGEIGITGSAAAVANAVFHATGRRICETPITLDKLI